MQKPNSSPARRWPGLLFGFIRRREKGEGGVYGGGWRQPARARCERSPAPEADADRDYEHDGDAPGKGGLPAGMGTQSKQARVQQMKQRGQNQQTAERQV